MDALRTPDECFAGLSGYPFQPRYATIDDLRLHYLDEGDPDGPVVLLLHGEPSWSYLYRTMIPPLVDAGCRVLAPDLIGFGRSDKPAAVADYSYQRHVDWMLDWLRQIDPDGVTLFCQDWGSLIGLRLVAAEPDRFARVFVGNGGLPTGDERVPAAFRLWRAFALYSPIFPVAGIMRVATRAPMSKATARAYAAPFPDKRYLAGARAFPALVPITPDDPASEPNREAWAVLRGFDKPFHTCFSDGDPITRGLDRGLRRRVPGAEGVEHTTIEGAGHFLQEDKGREIAAFMRRQMGC
ncbi:haloalkane dehalogenase [Spectribacter hydrogenoxidans]|uniref:Haloalkane dehalogenase n=1 Tax=Spectribacter hydrogenoxidans TaxID=3075608 RepID=A0ABU3BWL8_9GAMM|nr:haloalkane dehalogenase [Salinisphaera sp. W335]MDT0633689.1 haloalkane dehalogenase [Salinisphaera sp. W335]